MDDEQFQSVLADVAAGSTPTAACQLVLSTTSHMMTYLSEHPKGMHFQAALLQAEGDARIAKSDRMLEKLSDRVGDGFVTTPAVARIETDQINKLRTEGFNLRERAARQLSQLHEAEQKRISEANAPPEPVKQLTSWADADTVQQAIAPPQARPIQPSPPVLQANVPAVQHQTLTPAHEAPPAYTQAPRPQAAPQPEPEQQSNATAANDVLAMVSAELAALEAVTPRVHETVDLTAPSNAGGMNFDAAAAMGFAQPTTTKSSDSSAPAGAPKKNEAPAPRANPHARIVLGEGRDII